MFCGRLSARFRRLCFLEMADRRFKLIAASGVAESNDVAVVLGQRIGLYWLTRPRAGLVDAVGDVEVVQSALLMRNRFFGVQISVPPCVSYVYLQF